MRTRLVVAMACALGTMMIHIPPAFAVEPVMVIATDKPELGPAASTTYLAWFVPSQDFSRSNVWAEEIGSDAPFRVNPGGTTAYTGGIDGSTFVYQVSAKDQKPDIAMMDLSTKTPLDVPSGVNTDRAEFAPTISGNHLLFGRGMRDGRSVVLFDIATGTSEVLYSKLDTDKRSFDVLPLQVNGNYAVWQQIAFRASGEVVGGDVWLYDIAASTTTKIPNADQVWQYGVSVNKDGTVYFGRSNLECGEDAEVIQRLIDGTESSLYTFPTGRDFSFSVAVDNVDGTTDVYFDSGKCRGKDFGDIAVLPNL